MRDHYTEFRLHVDTDGWDQRRTDQFIADVLAVAERYGPECDVEIPLFVGRFPDRRM